MNLVFRHLESRPTSGYRAFSSSAFFESSGQGKRVKIPRGPRHCHRGRPGQQTTGRVGSKSVARPGRSPAAEDPEARRPAGRNASRSGNRRERAFEFPRARDLFEPPEISSRRTGGSNDDRGPARPPRRPVPASAPSSQLRRPGRARALLRRAPAAAVGGSRSAPRDGALRRGPGFRNRPRGHLSRPRDELRRLRRDRPDGPPRARIRAAGRSGSLSASASLALLSREQLRGVGLRPSLSEDGRGPRGLLCRRGPVLLEHAGRGPARDGGALRPRRPRAGAPAAGRLRGARPLSLRSPGRGSGRALRRSSRPPVAETVVVTANASSEDEPAIGAATTVMTRERIERGGFRTVAEVLRSVPGVDIVRSGSDGSVTFAQLRGANSTQTLVLVDGARLNSPYFPGYDFSGLTTENVERIEIVRGPFSALYGSDAIGGVIQIFTRAAARGLSGQATAEAGDAGQRAGLRLRLVRDPGAGILGQLPRRPRRRRPGELRLAAAERRDADRGAPRRERARGARSGDRRQRSRRARPGGARIPARPLREPPGTPGAAGIVFARPGHEATFLSRTSSRGRTSTIPGLRFPRGRTRGRSRGASPTRGRPAPTG